MTATVDRPCSTTPLRPGSSRWGACCRRRRDGRRSPGPAAYHGLLGEIVGRLEPETEADPIAILAQLLVSFGAAVGRGAYFQVEATRHHPQEFLLLVGESSTSRKGTSWDHARRLIATADTTLNERILTGLSSGEGLVWAVRDPTATDPGITDRRLLAFEAEFASALKAVTRDNSTLSATLRSAWDGRPLQLLTRTAPARASDAHVTVIGHITATELRHYLTGLELANGLANRFLLICCRRTRLLPEGGASDPLAGTGLTQLLGGAIEHARTAGRLHLDEHARELGITPTRSSPAPARPGSLVRSAPAPKHTSSGSRSSTRSPTANAPSTPSISKRRSRSGTTPPAQPAGH